MIPKRLQITVKNEELHKTIMSIPKTQRGQFISMALYAYIKTDEGQNLLNMFASHKPDITKLATEDQNATSTGGEVDDITGDFS